ncbi:MAG: DUF1761 domain-containing protein [Flavobacteriaceae bacterium]
MDLSQAFLQINWLSVGVAALSSFLLGGFWYGPLFGKTWMQAFNFTLEDLKTRSIPKTFGFSFLLAFFAAIILDMFIGHTANIVSGMLAGFFAGLGWVATFTGIQYLFEMKSLKIFIVNAGYSVVSLTIMGAILGAW